MDLITFAKNLYTTSGLSILLHAIISLSDVTSYDNNSSPASYDLGHLLLLSAYVLRLPFCKNMNQDQTGVHNVCLHDKI